MLLCGCILMLFFKNNSQIADIVLKFFWSPRLVVPPNHHCPPIVTVAIGAATEP